MNVMEENGEALLEFLFTCETYLWRSDNEFIFYNILCYYTDCFVAAE